MTQPYPLRLLLACTLYGPHANQSGTVRCRASHSPCLPTLLSTCMLHSILSLCLRAACSSSSSSCLAVVTVSLSSNLWTCLRLPDTHTHTHTTLSPSLHASLYVCARVSVPLSVCLSVCLSDFLSVFFSLPPSLSLNCSHAHTYVQIQMTGTTRATRSRCKVII